MNHIQTGILLDLNYSISVKETVTEEETGPWWRAFLKAEAQFKLVGHWPYGDDPDPEIAKWARIVASDLQRRREGKPFYIRALNLTSYRYTRLIKAGYVEPPPKSQARKSGGIYSQAEYYLDLNEPLPMGLLTKVKWAYRNRGMRDALFAKFVEHGYKPDEWPVE